jgi:hypothetical protein
MACLSIIHIQLAVVWMLLQDRQMMQPSVHVRLTRMQPAVVLVAFGRVAGVLVRS